MYKNIPTKAFEIEVVGPREIFDISTQGMVAREAAIVVCRSYLTPDEAREIAKQLNEAANLADAWGTVREL